MKGGSNSISYNCLHIHTLPEKLLRVTHREKTDFMVHKNANFFGFDFEFCTISMLVTHKK
jgi:hypothetical protein